MRHRTTQTTLVTFAAALALGLTACSGSGATAGKRVTLKTRLTSSEAAAPFTNAMGWTVALSRAAIATGAFYYYDGAPIFSWSPPRARGPIERLARLLAVRTAHAHPGHYVAGQAMGQMTEAFSADARAGDAAYPDGSGVTGVYRSARFTFGAGGVGPAASVLGAHVAVLEGTATKGAARRVFRATLDVKDVVDAKGQPFLEGCELREVTVEGDGTVAVNVRPTVWFDQVDFEKLAESADGQPVDVPGDSTAFNALTRGMKSSSAYVFTFTP